MVSSRSFSSAHFHCANQLPTEVGIICQLVGVLAVVRNAVAEDSTDSGFFIVQDEATNLLEVLLKIAPQSFVVLLRAFPC